VGNRPPRTTTTTTTTTGATTGATTDFVLPEGPTVVDVPLTDAPSYLFLFTHTEDQFNHELSEERYWRVGEMIELFAEENPDLGVVWTIEFQGSDAKTVLDRNATTGVADYLRTLQGEGLVQFGYHAHHDPTYLNRPQNALGADPSYDEVYEALFSWITCEKDPVVGGCVAPRGGGLEAILDGFGEVVIVTGLGIGEGVQIERSAGSQAVRDLLGDRMVAFGFPDHGATDRQPGYAAARDALLALLTPTHETSSGTLWMDNSIRINDEASVEGVDIGRLHEGPSSVAPAIEALDGTRSFVLNSGIADKYLYTVDSTSPTKWAYANPESPELPADLLNPTAERERRYARTQESLDYLAEVMTADPGIRFVDATGIVGLFTSEDYWTVDDDELEQIALWTLHHWVGRPPVWTYDGEDFYSLADTFALLAARLGGTSLDVVSQVYGPWSAGGQQAGSTSISVADLRTLIDSGLIDDGRIAEIYGDLSATQLLYAMAYLYVADRNGVEVGAIALPATAAAPETYDLLEDLGCTDCLDTAWSLKPARFQD